MRAAKLLIGLIMFDFEKLIVYQKSKEIRIIINRALFNKKNVDRSISDQIRRSLLGIILNIAEGTGKSSSADKRNFFTIARGSTYETAAITDLLFEDKIISSEEHKLIYNNLEEISKMLFGLINSLR